MNLDDLQQRANDNYATRLAALLDAILIAADAVEMDGNTRKRTGAVSEVAYQMHYKTTTVRRLAAMADLPEEAISLDTMIGAYWVAINNNATIAQVIQAVEAGVSTPAEMKEFLGIGSEREPRCVECPECGARFER